MSGLALVERLETTARIQALRLDQHGKANELTASVADKPEHEVRADPVLIAPGEANDAASSVGHSRQDREHDVSDRLLARDHGYLVTESEPALDGGAC